MLWSPSSSFCCLLSHLLASPRSGPTEALQWRRHRGPGDHASPSKKPHGPWPQSETASRIVRTCIGTSPVLDQHILFLLILCFSTEANFKFPHWLSNPLRKTDLLTWINYLRPTASVIVTQYKVQCLSFFCVSGQVLSVAVSCELWTARTVEFFWGLLQNLLK